MNSGGQPTLACNGQHHQHFQFDEVLFMVDKDLIVNELEANSGTHRFRVKYVNR